VVNKSIVTPSCNIRNVYKYIYIFLIINDHFFVDRNNLKRLKNSDWKFIKVGQPWYIYIYIILTFLFYIIRWEYENSKNNVLLKCNKLCSKCKECTLSRYYDEWLKIKILQLYYFFVFYTKLFSFSIPPI